MKIKGDAENVEVKNIIDGGTKVVIILGNPFETEHEIQQKLKPTQLVVHIGSDHNCWSEIADVVLPGQYYSEKKVTFTNKLQQVQSTDIAVQPLRRSRPEWQIILRAATGSPSQFFAFRTAPRNSSRFCLREILVYKVHR